MPFKPFQRKDKLNIFSKNTLNLIQHYSFTEFLIFFKLKKDDYKWCFFMNLTASVTSFLICFEFLCFVRKNHLSPYNLKFIIFPYTLKFNLNYERNRILAKSKHVTNRTQCNQHKTSLKLIQLNPDYKLCRWFVLIKSHYQKHPPLCQYARSTLHESFHTLLGWRYGWKSSQTSPQIWENDQQLVLLVSIFIQKRGLFCFILNF